MTIYDFLNKPFHFKKIVVIFINHGFRYNIHFWLPQQRQGASAFTSHRTGGYCHTLAALKHYRPDFPVVLYL